MKYASLFSGIGGFDLGLERAGMTPTVQVEWDKRCQSVLQRHWPDVPRYGDVTEVKGDDLGRPDLVCGGWPCQDLSVAGRRAGLAGERSGLFHEFMRLVAEISPTWILAENVPGLLSSNEGRDMGVVLGTLGELGYGWAYRVLDARYFGVAQRRRRVFIVGCLGDAGRAAEVLFEPESCAGDTAPSREPGAEVAGDVAARLNSGGNSGGFRTEPGEHLVAEPFRKATTLHTAESNDERWEPAEATNTIAGHGTTTREAIVMAPAFSKRPGQQIATRDDGLSYALSTGEPPRVLSFNWQSGGDVRLGVKEEQTDALHSSQSPAIQENGQQVRRLTPTECARLQGFPDDWNDWLPDSTRYRQFGNAVCVPVARWIGKRILEVA